MTPRPPRLARWLLERFLPADARTHLPDELEELFQRRVADGGRTSAALWYWRQVPAFAIRLLIDRLRGTRAADIRIGFSWIDYKLALRMLVRYPWLTLVSVFGMAVGITIAAGVFTVTGRFLNPALPLDEGDRVVVLQLLDVRTENRELRSQFDYGYWREELKSVEDIGAFAFSWLNLIVPGATPESVNVVFMSAAGFRVARTAAALGRPLLPEDERPGAPHVMVIGDGVWRRKFGADPGILGREVQLGTTTYTVVGVMPPGFAFPINNSYWVPLPLGRISRPLSGGPLHVFARLAPGATMASARAELSAFGERMSVEYPATHQHLRQGVWPYAHAFTGVDEPEHQLMLRAVQTAVIVLLLIVCVNVAILVYARTATRQGEIAVRTALGATRYRIVAQLFSEAFVLAGVAGLAGIGLARVLLEYGVAAVQQMEAVPFWLALSLSGEDVLLAVACALLAAAVVGVVPALKATGRRVQGRLQGLSAGSGSQMQMGRLWTTLIVAQVAVAVALLPATTYHAWNTLRLVVSPGYAAHEYLMASFALDLEEPAPDDAARFGQRQTEVERALENDPRVAAVSFAQSVPGREPPAIFEIEGTAAPGRGGHVVRFNKIAPDFFAAFDVPVLMGRGLEAADAAPAARRVVVNRRFVETFFDGESPLGRRVRYVDRSREAATGNVELKPWLDIVGVVADFPPHATTEEGRDPRLYHASVPGDLSSAQLIVRVRGGQTGDFAARLREITAAVDPRLLLRDLTVAETAIRNEQRIFRLTGALLLALTLAVVVLAAAGIYALMSFTVSRRRKEIGIRTALGADPRRILAGIFSRALGQLAAGAALGMVLAIGGEQVSNGDMLEGSGAVVIPIVAVFMTLVGLSATYGPARRGLRIHPTDALRDE